ncbi:hypothetical protein DM860_013381 [Cuscuta australis]|uniref:Uncharacterized protein n=1 Tax=Cuscuta australis TaxID=267555 RepID=A0A328DPN7_9ASTE|nr:hypothetical protein DM860_013381 [Cuscuta australis]
MMPNLKVMPSPNGHKKYNFGLGRILSSCYHQMSPKRCEEWQDGNAKQEVVFLFLKNAKITLVLIVFKFEHTEDIIVCKFSVYKWLYLMCRNSQTFVIRGVKVQIILACV